jgi:6-phosphogluconolactonase
MRVGRFMGKKGQVSAVHLLVGLGLLTLVLSGCDDGKAKVRASSSGSATKQQWAYVANSGSSSVSAYLIDESTGQLTAFGGSFPAAAGGGAYQITVNNAAKLMYVTNFSASPGSISAYTIDGSTGVLTQVTNDSPYVLATTQAGSVATTPAGTFAYATAAGNVSYPFTGLTSFSIASGTGALTSLGTTPFGLSPDTAVVDPTGKYLYIRDVQSLIYGFSINAATGALTSLGAGFPTGLGAGGETPGMVIDSTGSYAYVVSYNDFTLRGYTLNSGTGALTEFPGVSGDPYVVGGIVGPYSVAISGSGKYVYVVDQAAGTPGLYAFSVNSGTGYLTAVAGSPFTTGLNSPQSVATNAAGTVVYVVNSGNNTVSTFSVNSSTGALTSMGSLVTGSGPKGIAIFTGP